MGQIIDGKSIAKKIREEVGVGVAKLKKERGIIPKLVVVLSGDDPASHIYVKNKEKACAEVGIASDVFNFSHNINENKIIETINKLNNDKSVHGILVQLPLLKHLNTTYILDQLSPQKDVDGLHPINLGKLLKSEDPLFVPCTPQGIIELILSTGEQILGKEAVVVGRSNIVGKPVSLLLLQQHATVTLCHSRTKNLGEVTRRADILVAAIGKAKMIKGDMVKKGAIIIDVGMNRVGDKLCGDVDFESVKQKAGYITPVPGGVGPMTIAMLLKNTLLAAGR